MFLRLNLIYCSFIIVSLATLWSSELEIYSGCFLIPKISVYPFIVVIYGLR